MYSVQKKTSCTERRKREENTTMKRELTVDQMEAVVGGFDPISVGDAVMAGTKEDDGASNTVYAWVMCKIADFLSDYPVVFRGK